MSTSVAVPRVMTFGLGKSTVVEFKRYSGSLNLGQTPYRALYIHQTQTVFNTDILEKPQLTVLCYDYSGKILQLTVEFEFVAPTSPGEVTGLELTLLEQNEINIETTIDSVARHSDTQILIVSNNSILLSEVANLGSL